MSMRPLPAPEVPGSTSRVARAVFPRGCLAMRIRDELGAVFGNERFASCGARKVIAADGSSRADSPMVAGMLRG